MGTLRFQEYFVKHQWQPALRGVRFEGAEQAQATPQVRDALQGASAIILCPSNPFVSIEPLLQVSPVRATLRASRVPIVAVSPIVGGQAIKGPAAKMFAELGEEPSALAVARRYADFLDGFLLDERDAAEAEAIRALGLPRCHDRHADGRCPLAAARGRGSAGAGSVAWRVVYELARSLRGTGRGASIALSQ